MPPLTSGSCRPWLLWPIVPTAHGSYGVCRLWILWWPMCGWDLRWRLVSHLMFVGRSLLFHRIFATFAITYGSNTLWNGPGPNIHILYVVYGSMHEHSVCMRIRIRIVDLFKSMTGVIAGGSNQRISGAGHPPSPALRGGGGVFRRRMISWRCMRYGPPNLTHVQLDLKHCTPRHQPMIT